ncbi:sensor histidine kinase [Uliginosibacterium sp. H1]|uniref:sensor histidine kinase n=1 Tax=Uliginosibacterium sp. H1 TaxID=3114757 RepID=UPI002E171F64|nr:HAMP domain-containing sensor histidine kinase [Uliginosibacterium sp. H1]
MPIEAARARVLNWLLLLGVAGIVVVVAGLVADLDILVWLGLIGAACGIGLAWSGLQTDGEDETPSPAVTLQEAAASEDVRFISTAGHDLRQPIQAISLFAATLAAHPLPENTRKLVGQLDEAAVALSELFEAVIAYAKAESGRLELAVQSMPVGDVLAAAVAANLEDAHERDLHLRQVASGMLLRADPVQLQHALTALVQHALRTTVRGGAVLGCRRRGAWVAIELWDSGNGLQPEQVGKALTPFAACWQSLADRGLGLARTARVAGLMGGEMQVASRPGRGTVYRILLPRA